MKKILFLSVLLMVSLMMTSQTDTTKLSNYEKYLIAKENGVLEKPAVKPIVEDPEFDDLYFQPYKERQKMKDKNRKDTIEKKVVIVKNYHYYHTDPYFYSNCIGRFHHRGFNYWYYSNPYFYSDFGWGYPSYYYHFSPVYNSFYWRNELYYNNFYYGYVQHNYYYNSYQSIKVNVPRETRRVTASNYSPTYNSTNRKIESPEGQRNRTETTQRRITPSTTVPYSETRRTYTPTYETPRPTTRPVYNNSRISTPQNMGNQRTNTTNPNVNMPNSRRVNTVTSIRNYGEQTHRQSLPSSRIVNSDNNMNRGSGSGVSNSNSGVSVDRRSVSSVGVNNGGTNTSRTTGSSGNINNVRR